MNIVDIIIKKRNGGKLDESEIRFFVEGVARATIQDYQISALLMAIFFQGMDEEETATLTKEMAMTGDILSFPNIHDPIVDKHSSGGVGDKTSLVLAPIVAACGLPIAKLSGRGLGFTGGTVDKLESFPGFRTELSEEEFSAFVERDGIALMGQSADIAPADKKLYALRDVTGTVDSIPLIAASIMSKKLADGSDAIVLDVKCGSGAFMKTPQRAIELAGAMVSIGEANGKRTIALVTNMDQPLGEAVGNSLEVIEAINTLRGEGPADFTEECYALAASMLMAGERAKTQEEARELVRSVIEDGRAMEKLRCMVRNQGSDPAYVDDPNLFDKAALRVEGAANRDGYVAAINAEEIGKSSLLLGAGRLTTEDVIDPAVGLLIHRKIGDFVKKGEALFTVCANDEQKAQEAVQKARAAYVIADEPVETPSSPIIATVTRDGVQMEANHA
ncbi:MAG: thymidine phosphorylase [Ndongobacter sp.]|nr:thymidine phosphorylase [Ndongobacter sp.]